MKHDLSRHPYFEAWVDPRTGVENFLLAERVAPFQKGLYYTTPSVSADGRWLWFAALYPPSRGCLAAVCLDPDDPQMRLLPEAQLGGNPLLMPEGDAAYVPIGTGIYRVTLDRQVAPVVRMPAEILRNRHVFDLVSNLTLSADGKYFVLDSHIGNRWLVSVAEVATGEVTPLRWFVRCHHQSMFSTVDPQLILTNQGPWHDPITGEKGDMNIRMWLMDTKLTRYEPLYGDLWFNHNCMSCHEWWSPQGNVCWVDYSDGIYESPTGADRARALVWPHRGLCHGQSDPTGRWIIADENPYGRSRERPCRVLLFDRTTRREVAVCSDAGLPPIADPADWRSYHLDPHPHFSSDGQLAVYTTCARGTVDVALAPLAAAAAKLP